MPYIQSEDRPVFDEVICEIPNIETPGELNYIVTTIIQKYISTHGDSYTTYNSVVGALECCKLEFYRRLVTPYEDEKIKLNGDAY